MKTNLALRIATALLSLSILLHSPSTFAQGTAFTYQGRLESGGAPHTGTAEFQATLWDAVSGGSQIAASAPAQVVVGVTNGLFILPLDFDANFPGANRWLQLEVRTTIGNFTTLAPRQPLTPTPYAITASNLSGTLPAFRLSGAIPSVNLSGTYSGAVTFDNAASSFTGDGAGLTALNASELASGTVADARLGENVARTNQVWLLGGNAGTMPGTHFLGTRDEQPLEFKVNGARALRLEFHTNHLGVGSPSPNVISGHADNEVAPGVSGATIAGGGGTNWWGPTSPQRASGEFSTIGGGIGNIVQGAVGVIAGGERGFIGSNAFNAFIGGGAWNTNLSGDATIGGGRNNLIPVSANNATIGGGAQNAANNANATVGGGLGNTASGIEATVGGGTANTAGGVNATVAGGYVNAASGSYATVGGGAQNIASGNYSTVPGGNLNLAAGAYTFAAGQRAKANHQGAFVWADSQNADFATTANNQFSVRAAGGVRLDGDVQIGTGSGDYQHLRIGGGNSDGFLYGSFLRFADGVHLGYNYYADAGGAHRVNNPGGATSRISVGYGYIGLGTGGVNTAPTTDRLVVGTTSVTVTGTFNNNSDRNAKQAIEPINPSQILDHVIALPLSQWSYKTDPATRHLGPMAQDFHAAFNLGTDEKHIAPLDEAGVALAAIQGLNEKVEVRSQKAEDRMQKLEAENSELKTRLANLELLLNLNPK
ncbi:MAG: tail fiber domain-containing protein [Verrucomicrobia bacterium]|nr:tail fiber domain-containing protein [Verrucomicrobiota bacterium]